MVNAGAAIRSNDSPTTSEGGAHLHPPNYLDRLKNSLAAVMNTVINMANSFYYVSRIAFATENLCVRISHHELGSLLKSVGNITYSCANAVFYLYHFQLVRRLTAMGGLHPREHVLMNMMRSLGQLVDTVKRSHAPELVNELINSTDSDAPWDKRGLANLVSLTCQDIIEFIETKLSEYKKTLFLFKAFKMTADISIRLTETSDSILSALKCVSTKIKEGFYYAALFVEAFIISPLLMALKNIARLMVMLLSHLIITTPRQ